MLILVITVAVLSVGGTGMLFSRKMAQLEHQFEAERERAARVEKVAVKQSEQVIDGRGTEVLRDDSGQAVEGGIWQEAEGSPAVYEGVEYIYGGKKIGLISGKIWLDEITGLAWSAPSTEPMDNRMEVKDGKATGTGAVGFCEVLARAAYGGRRNWRLPTQTQLMQAYVDGGAGKLTENPRYFWSATEFFSDKTRAWRVNMAAGDVTSAPKTDSVNSYAICVAGK